jgi:hypothetical protein
VAGDILVVREEHQPPPVGRRMGEPVIVVVRGDLLLLAAVRVPNAIECFSMNTLSLPVGRGLLKLRSLDRLGIAPDTHAILCCSNSSLKYTDHSG